MPAVPTGGFRAQIPWGPGSAAVRERGRCRRSLPGYPLQGHPKKVTTVGGHQKPVELGGRQRDQENGSKSTHNPTSGAGDEIGDWSNPKGLGGLMSRESTQEAKVKVKILTSTPGEP